jgi:hypothetical protein
MGRLFEPGYFSLQNLFETDGGNPVFYARIPTGRDEWGYVNNYNNIKITKDNYDANLIKAMDGVGMKIRPKQITSVIIGTEIDKDEEIGYMFTTRFGTMLFEKFYGVGSPLLKDRQQPLRITNARVRN